MFALELAELGLPPLHAANILKSLWLSDIARIFQSEWRLPSSDASILAIETNLLSRAWNKEYRAAATTDPQNIVIGTAIMKTVASKLSEALQNSGEWRHASLINVTRLVSKVERELEGILPSGAVWLTEAQTA